MIYGLAETLFSPVVPALVNDLATDDIRGRANSVNYMAWQGGYLLGPALGGTVLSVGGGAGWILTLLALNAAAVVLALRLGHQLGAAEQITPRDSGSRPRGTGRPGRRPGTAPRGRRRFGCLSG